jgi:hypothetical protein
MTAREFAALIELTVSPPAFASPRICAFDDCTRNRTNEKSEADSRSRIWRLGNGREVNNRRSAATVRLSVSARR